MPEKEKNEYSAPALEKGLEIIELLADQQSGMRMSEIAKALGRSKNEIFRVISVLVRKNYLKKEESGNKYVITNNFFDIGMRTPLKVTLIERTLPIMREFSNQVEQSCHLTVRSGDYIVVIARVENPGPVGVTVRLGVCRNLLESASGNVFLAWMPEEQRVLSIKRILEKSNEKNQKPELGALNARFDNIRQLGYFIKPSELISGTTDISTPIRRGDSDTVLATLTVPYTVGVETSHTLNETVEALQEAANTVSRIAASVSEL